jgi:hypothetical protein
MSDTGFYATTKQIQDKAGIYANATASADPYTNSFVAQAEGIINTTAKRVFAASAAAFAALPAGGKAILTSIASALAAIQVINADMSGFTNTREAESMKAALLAEANAGLILIKDKNFSDFIVAGA